MMPKLTHKQAFFVKEYLIDLNATQAAMRAGYSKKTAHRIGAENMQKHAVTSAIQKHMDKRAEKIDITSEYVLTSIKAVADRCMQAVPVLDSDGKETGEWRFEHSGANKSLELLGKHLKLFTEQVEWSGVLGLKAALDGAEQMAGNIPSEDG